MRGDACALEGIPTSVKDKDASAGWPLTAGSALMKDNWAIGPDG
jgi:Asp-tRNA(Asn)/Glu-tRNA(Gln) amidotransferase A subunit family amidase